MKNPIKDQWFYYNTKYKMFGGPYSSLEEVKKVLAEARNKCEQYIIFTAGRTFEYQTPPTSFWTEV